MEGKVIILEIVKADVGLDLVTGIEGEEVDLQEIGVEEAEVVIDEVDHMIEVMIQDLTIAIEDAEMIEIVETGEIVIEIEGIEGMIEEMVDHIEMMTEIDEMIEIEKTETTEEIEMEEGGMMTIEEVDLTKEMVIEGEEMIGDLTQIVIHKEVEVMTIEEMIMMQNKIQDQGQVEGQNLVEVQIENLKIDLKMGREDMMLKVITIDRKMMSKETGIIQ